MEAVILILALLFVAFVALGVYAGVKTVRAAKRGVDRTVTQARRSVENTALWAKSYGQPGVQGELAQLRLTLRTSMRATQDTLNAGVAQDGSLSESLELFRRLSVHGHELDDELKRLEREPDRATVASLLPGLKERTEHITHSAESLRWAARDRAKRFADDDLSALNAQIDLEAGALRHWTTEEPAAPDGTTGRSWSGPADEASSTTPSSATSSSATTPPPPTSPPPSLTAPDARLRTGYPWQKSARPETTN
ncbi:hypothetical protein [Streptomyces sp. NPDC048565]|uniref:hypothetical protein n=1 Tax=Streptomyces sp. NPDC048565 TaxID=3155266 RepID=UPI00343EA032